MAGDDKGPMQDPRSTRQVLDAAPKVQPERDGTEPGDDTEPNASPTDDSTAPVKTDQEDA